MFQLRRKYSCFLAISELPIYYILLKRSKDNGIFFGLCPQEEITPGDIKSDMLSNLIFFISLARHRRTIYVRPSIS